MILPSFLLAIYYPQIGKLAGILGSAATMLVIYIVPNVTYLKMKWDATFKKGQTENKFDIETRKQEADRDGHDKVLSSEDARTSEMSRHTDVNGPNSDSSGSDPIEEDPDFDKRIAGTSKLMLAVIIVFSLFVTSYGIWAFVLQFTG